MVKYILIVFIGWMANSVYAQTVPVGKPIDAQSKEPKVTVVCGAERMPYYLPELMGRNVALLVNQTSMVGGKHLVDTLLASGIHIRKIFAPEHGFRGGTEAGGDIKSGTDSATKLPIISIYGNKKKPSEDDLKDIDVVVFDIQDVGARFYTFISSLHYLMEACAENGKPLIILDRPNPNGWYVDGPVLKKEFQSFVGVDPIPVVHGLTVGEYAQMANGEGWLTNGEQCQITVVKCLLYDHKTKYTLPVKPSPNLPGYLAISLYPSLAFFEGTNISVGRGTFVPFQIIGSPLISFKGAFSFTPKSRPEALTPPFQDQKCYGLDLRKSENWYKEAFTFQYVIDMFDIYPDKKNFFLKDGNFFDKLCGNADIRRMIIEGKTEKEIKASYQRELADYKAKRKKYLLYRDFE